MQSNELQAKVDAAFLEGQKAYVLGLSPIPTRWTELEALMTEVSMNEVKPLFSSWLNGYKHASMQRGKLMELLSQAIASVPKPISSPVIAQASEFQSALHDINNLLMMMSTYTTLAINKLPSDSPAYAHARLAQEAVGQAALFAHELQIALK